MQILSQFPDIGQESLKFLLRFIFTAWLSMVMMMMMVVMIPFLEEIYLLSICLLRLFVSFLFSAICLPVSSGTFLLGAAIYFTHLSDLKIIILDDFKIITFNSVTTVLIIITSISVAFSYSYNHNHNNNYDAQSVRIVIIIIIIITVLVIVFIIIRWWWSRRHTSAMFVFTDRCTLDISPSKAMKRMMMMVKMLTMVVEMVTMLTVDGEDKKLKQ